MTNHPAVLKRNELKSAFMHFFSNVSSYAQLDPEPLIPLDDKTVYYVSATINRFKRQMVKGLAPDTGQVLHQRCLRLFSINTILEDNQSPYFCYFSMLGIYRVSDKLAQVCEDLKKFLQTDLSLPSTKIKTVASEADRNVFGAAAVGLNAEFVEDSDEFAWKFGIPSVHGRGLLIQIESKSGEWREVGQIIYLYKDNQPFGCELAMGVEMLQWALSDESDFRKCWTVQNLADEQNLPQDWRYLDSVSTLATMYAAGTPNDNSKHGQLLKKVLRNLYYICEEQGISDDDVQRIFDSFSKVELGVDLKQSSFTSDFIKIKEQSAHNLARFSEYVTELKEKVKSGELTMVTAFNRAAKKADGASFVPKPVRDRVLQQNGIKPIIG